MGRTSATASSSAVSVTTSATLLAATASGRDSLSVQPTNGDIYVGPTSGVTTSSGVKVASGNVGSFDNYSGTLYGIASGTVDVRVWKQG